MILKLYRAVAARFKVFENKDEMNEHINAYIFAAGRKLHKNARAVLNVITRHSCVVSGVSWLNEETIAESTGVCLRTVKRALERIVSLGIGRFETVEINGMTLRYFILHKFDVSDICLEFDSRLSSPKMDINLTDASIEPVFTQAETNESRETEENNLLSNNVSAEELDASFTPSIVPKEFVEVVAPFYRSANDIYSLWNRAIIAHRNSRLDNPIESVIGPVIKAFKDSIFASKRGRVRRDFNGYFYGTLSSLLFIEKRREINFRPLISEVLT